MSVQRIFHLTAVVPDTGQAVQVSERLFGATVLHRVTDVTNGATMDRALLWIGDTVLEVLQPIGPSPFQTFLERFGGGLNAIGVQVDDATTTRTRLAGLGVDIALDFEPQMFATRPSSSAGLALQWSGRAVPDDPRDGAALHPPASAVVPARRLAATLAVVDDPEAAGHLLAAALGTGATPLGADASGRPVVAVGLGDGSLVLTATSTEAAPWPGPQARPRVLGLAFEVDDVASSCRALEAAGLVVTGQHLLGPVLAGEGSPWPVVLTAGLPAGDPRSGAPAPRAR